MAGGSWARLRGIKAVPRDWGLLLRTHSVHTFGIRRPLLVAVVGDDGRLLARRTLMPRRVMAVTEARWIVELPAGSDVPRPGTLLELQVRHRPG
jgi:hypothetical protein